MPNRKFFNICLYASFLYFKLFFLFLNAGEKELMDLADKFYLKSEYHSAVTGLMRYQYSFPDGKYFPKSMLFMGKAYFRGGNYAMAMDTLSSCYTMYPDRPSGEEALYVTGVFRLLKGSPFYSLRTFQEYRYIYKKGKFDDAAAFNMSYASALTPNLDVSLENIRRYRSEFPEGKYHEKADELERNIKEELNRPKKSATVSVLGSVFLPGFGHFYTGRYTTGFLSLFTNALLIYLIYDGYRDSNRAQMIFFSVMEFSFYNYSLVGAVRNVHEYNSREKFYRRVRLSIGTDF